jgi:hypothetical protein
MIISPKISKARESLYKYYKKWLKEKNQVVKKKK